MTKEVLAQHLLNEHNILIKNHWDYLVNIWIKVYLEKCATWIIIHIFKGFEIGNKMTWNSWKKWSILNRMSLISNPLKMKYLTMKCCKTKHKIAADQSIMCRIFSAYCYICRVPIYKSHSILFVQLCLSLSLSKRACFAIYLPFSHL